MRNIRNTKSKMSLLPCPEGRSHFLLASIPLYLREILVPGGRWAKCPPQKRWRLAAGCVNGIRGIARLTRKPGRVSLWTSQPIVSPIVGTNSHVRILAQIVRSYYRNVKDIMRTGEPSLPLRKTTDWHQCLLHYTESQMKSRCIHHVSDMSPLNR